MEPCIAAKHPFRVDVKSGQRYSWCACGYSKKQPFCDGSHKALAPKISPFRFIPEQDGTLLLCGCKHTSNAPYCDGTHKQDFVQKVPLTCPCYS
uniref:Iron-binding zinc finger CDGSH type domain-containing protein n=1 Tax=Paramormyrops kingsleyae TaxID=1676925 RepID=A0A3B3S0Y1_9TELE